MNDISKISSMRDKIKCALDLSKIKVFPALSPNLSTLQQELRIESNPPNLSGFCAFAERVVGWIPLNPNDIKRVKALVSAYHLPGYDYVDPNSSTLEEPHPVSKEYVKERGEDFSYNSNILPTKEGLIALFDSMCQRNDQLILILGKRGSGKTVALNFFFTTAHRALADKKIIWFRTDIAKLWVYKEKYLTVLQYTILHSIYVSIKYSSDDSNLQCMINYGEGFSSYLNTLLSEDDQYIKNIVSAWGQIVSAYRHVERLAEAKDKEDQKPALDFLREGRSVIDEYKPYVIENLYKEMLNYLRLCNNVAGDDRRLRIVLIFDGVDNIRVDAQQDRYKSFINQINDIVSKTPLEIADKFVFVARPETYNDMSNMKITMVNGRVNPNRFYLDANFIPELLKKKSDAIENPVEYFQWKAEVYTGKKYIDVSKSKDFISSINYLLSIFRRESLTAQQIDSKNISPIDMIFDGNIRSMLRNAIRAHHHKLRLAHTLVGRRRALLEGSILAGCNSMANNFNESVHGHWCPNLFEYSEVEKGCWTGLIMVRVIQLMGSVQEGISKEDAKRFLMSNFGYPEGCCDHALQAAVEYALIRNVQIKFPVLDEKSQRPIMQRRYVTTPKGKYIMNLAFTDYATFYFMAVATPMDFERLKLIDVNYEDLFHDYEKERHFYRAAILSGFLLWIHIKTAYKQEKSGYEIGKAIYKGGVEIKPSVFEIPYINEWLSSAEDLLEKLVSNKNYSDICVIKNFIEKYVSSE